MKPFRQRLLLHNNSQAKNKNFTKMTHKPVAKSKYSLLPWQSISSLGILFITVRFDNYTLTATVLHFAKQSMCRKHMHTANAFVLFVPFHSFRSISFCSIPEFTNTNVQVLIPALLHIICTSHITVTAQLQL